MLDADLTDLYDVEVKQLKRQVRKKKDWFPGDFLLELSQEEHRTLRCQIGTLKSEGNSTKKVEVVAHCDYLKKLKGSPAKLFALNDQGAAMVENTSLFRSYS